MLALPSLYCRYHWRCCDGWRESPTPGAIAPTLVEFWHGLATLMGAGR